MSEQLQRERQRSNAGGIELSNVSHGFDGSEVLRDVTLTVEPGETLAIIGPSGTGKTTLLRLMSLFHPPDDGTVRIAGADPWSLSERERLEYRRRIGMVFQEANLFDTSVRRNVEYGRHVRRKWRERLRRWFSRVRDDEVPPSVAEALELVGLEEAATRNVSSLSGGEAQRVSFARALAYDPGYLLLDEPTSDLDPRNTAIIEEAIEAARARNIGIVLATHDMHQAERIADRTVVLLEGRVIESGPTDRVFTAPDDPRARAFIDGELVY